MHTSYDVRYAAVMSELRDTSMNQDQAPETLSESVFPSGWEPRTLDELMNEFPGWQGFKGVNNLWYARRLLSSPEILLRGEDLIDLKDQLIGWLWRNQR